MLLVALHGLEVLCLEEAACPEGLGTAIQRRSDDSVWSQCG